MSPITNRCDLVHEKKKKKKEKKKDKKKKKEKKKKKDKQEETFSTSRLCRDCSVPLLVLRDTNLQTKYDTCT